MKVKLKKTICILGLLFCICLISFYACTTGRSGQWSYSPDDSGTRFIVKWMDNSNFRVYICEDILNDTLDFIDVPWQVNIEGMSLYYNNDYTRNIYVNGIFALGNYKGIRIKNSGNHNIFGVTSTEMFLPRKKGILRINEKNILDSLKRMGYKCVTFMPVETGILVYDENKLIRGIRETKEH